MYCHRLISTIFCRPSFVPHLNLFLRNHFTKWNLTWQKCYLDNPQHFEPLDKVEHSLQDVFSKTNTRYNGGPQQYIGWLLKNMQFFVSMDVTTWDSPLLNYLQWWHPSWFSDRLNTPHFFVFQRMIQWPFMYSFGFQYTVASGKTTSKLFAMKVAILVVEKAYIFFRYDNNSNCCLSKFRYKWKKLKYYYIQFFYQILNIFFISTQVI